MNRDKVLEEVQNEKKHHPDEREMQIMQKGSGISVFCMLVFALILMVVKICTNQPWYDLYSLMFVSIASIHFYKGIKLKEKHELAYGILFGALALLALGSAIYEYLTMG